jgi:two-component sensor histidine kinase
MPVLVSVSVPAAAVEEAWGDDVRLYALVAALATLALGLLSVQALREAAADLRTQEELERRVSERTEALVTANRQLEVLFQEVHHRVKNNLQVITSLLRLQSSRVADEGVRQALRESIDRVQAMALVHKLLYSSNEISDLDFATYARTLASHLEGAYGTAGRIAVGSRPRMRASAWTPRSRSA